MEFDWNPIKNEELKSRFGIGFERALAAIAEGNVLDERVHPNAERYRNQRQLVVAIDGYAWVVAFVADGKHGFLKTMYPSRKATRDYLGE